MTCSPSTRPTPSRSLTTAPGCAPTRPGATERCCWSLRRAAHPRRPRHPLHRRPRAGRPRQTRPRRRRLPPVFTAPLRLGYAEPDLLGLAPLLGDATEIALLTNPESGRGRGARARRPALARLRDAGFTVRDVVGRDADEAQDLACQAVADRLAALVVFGGDGMVHLAVQAVAGTPTALGVIPAGTGNDVARCLDLPRGDPAAAADRVAERLADGRVRRSTSRAAGGVLRDRDRRRVRRARQRAGQPDAVAAGPDPLQLGHDGRAPDLPAARLHPGPRRRSVGSRRCWSRSATGRRSAGGCGSPRAPSSTTGCSTS